MFVFALMQFCFAPLIGNLSDRFGRRPVLLLSLTTLSVDYLIMGFAPTLAWLFAGRILSGASAATHATANAYIADITRDEERAARFGLVAAAWGVGFVIGPAAGGMLGEIAPRAPFYVAAGLALLNVTYGLLVLPETLPRDRRRAFRFARANPVGAFAALRPYPVIMGLLGTVALYFIAHDVNPAIWTYYVLHKFQWSSSQVGVALALVGLSSAVVSGVLVGPIVRRIGEARAAGLGLVMAALGFYGHAFASEGWMLIPAIAAGAFMGLVMPSLRGIMSRRMPDESQGELQGAIASLMGLTMIFAPLLMTQTFRYFSAPGAPLYFPGAGFFLAGTLALAALFAMMRALQR